MQGNETFVTTSKERRKRVAFAEIVRSGHSKQIMTRSVACDCTQAQMRHLRSVDRTAHPFCAVHRDLNLCAKNLHTTMLCIVRTVRPTNASLWRVNSPRFAITLVSLATSLEKRYKKETRSNDSCFSFLCGTPRLACDSSRTAHLCATRTA